MIAWYTLSGALLALVGLLAARFLFRSLWIVFDMEPRVERFAATVRGGA